MDENMKWLPTWQHFLLGEFFGSHISWATLNSWRRNLTPKEFQHEVLISFFSNFFFILSAIPTIALNNLALGWNSWPTNTLLHHSPSCKPAPKCCTQSYDIQLGHSIDKGVLSTNRKVGMWDNHKPLTCGKHINFAWKNLRTSNTPFGWRMWLHGLFPRK